MKLFVCSLIFCLSAHANDNKKSYNDLISLLNVKLEKVREMQEQVDILLKEKSHISDRTRVLEIIAELNDYKTKMNAQNVEIRELDYDLRFRYPEKGDQTERVYKQFNTSSEQVAKKEQSLLQKLNLVLDEAKKIYGPTQRELELADQRLKREVEQERKPASMFERIQVTD